MNDIQLTSDQISRIESAGLSVEQIKAERIEIEQMYDGLIGRLLDYHAEADHALVRKAFEYAYDSHLLQRRKSGEPYIIHPVGVATLVTQLKLDEASICAALLHDVVEDTDATRQDIVNAFGEEIANLVDALTKLDKYQFTSKEERQAANFCKMLFAMNSDLRCILIKLADRVHNMRTLQHMRPDKQASIAQETLDIYVPIANRLGIEWMKAELEDICLKYLHPEEYAELNAKITALMQDKHDYIERVKGILNDALLQEGITGFKLKGRVKHIYSIYRKLKRSNGIFENLHDVIAFRVIVNTKAECYHVLGIVHGMWTLVENRFKDYISRPKANHYSSLHTSVIGPEREHFEVQIRTYEMDQVAEEGIAAHWKYKEGNITPAQDARDFAWLRQLVEFHEDSANSDSNYFLNSVKVDLFNNDVFVFTPNGEIKALPQGSCPIDFAYAVHSEVGDHCSGALVNGNIVSLRYELKTGDVVDIITRANQKPKSDWLQIVATNRAKSKINKFLTQEERNTHKQIGIQIAEKLLKKVRMNPNQFERMPDLQKFLSSLKQQNLEALYVSLGSEKISPETFIEKIQPYANIAPEEEPAPAAPQMPFFREERAIEKLSKRAQTNVCVDGIDNLVIHFAKCCSPVPGEPIVGFITRGRGLAIHHMNCPRIQNLEPERHVACHWDPRMADSSATRSVNIQVVATDRIGILQDVVKVMSEMKINISQTHCRTLADSMQSILTFEVQVVDIKQLNMLLRNIQRTPGVITAERSKT